MHIVPFSCNACVTLVYIHNNWRTQYKIIPHCNTNLRKSFSWTCVRSQYQETTKESSITVHMPTVETNLSWCSGADEWDENDNGDTANGNFMNVDNAPSPNNGMHR